MAREYVVWINVEVRDTAPGERYQQEVHSAGPVATFPTVQEAVAYTSALHGELLERSTLAGTVPEEAQIDVATPPTAGRQ